jgi:PEP-CTERM motif
VILRRGLIIAGLALAPLAAQANLILNGGFESPDISTGTFSLFPAMIPGWIKTVGPNIEIQDNVAGAPFEGQQFVELDSTGNSGMSQSVATTVGASYLLAFAYSPRPNVGSASNGIELWIDGLLRDSFTGAGIGTTNWAVRSYSVIGDGATLIEFRAIGTSDSLGGYLDDVRLTTPEPGTLALGGLALTALALLRRRKRA